ncbi:hypothetical protein [Flavobacterium sharifuzzamanii]|uniref:hypothetical protein n=1 Tax=Flavobacterium sharifuzzamanii TaxID=2211133 RepID=UPI000DAE4B93|nr:hypothetical protein [Flavobacterium sharifuzzamanii]KAF2080848.1 hypothetical protein DMA14_11805 [Flavobacterium sharifuzzamanii]
MVKKILAPATIAIFFWGIGLLLINQYYYEYVRYYLYISILVIFPFMVWNLIKQWKKDKVEETNEFKTSIFRMLIMAVVMIVIFYVTKQNHI